MYMIVFLVGFLGLSLEARDCWEGETRVFRMLSAFWSGSLWFTYWQSVGEVCVKSNCFKLFGQICKAIQLNVEHRLLDIGNTLNSKKQLTQLLYLWVSSRWMWPQPFFCDLWRLGGDCFNPTMDMQRQPSLHPFPVVAVGSVNLLGGSPQLVRG